MTDLISRKKMLMTSRQNSRNRSSISHRQHDTSMWVERVWEKRGRVVGS